MKEKLTGTCTCTLRKAACFFKARKEGEQQLIVAIVMIAIAVGLLFIFKDRINTMVGDFMTSITSKINNALGTI